MKKNIKLLAINLLVALIIAVSFIGFLSADGVDKPGFYDEPQQQPINKQPNNIPSVITLETDNIGYQKMNVVPEPEIIFMVLIGLIGVWKITNGE